MRDVDFRAIHGALTNRGAVRRVAERYAGVSYDTLLSIYALKYQQHAIASMEGHKAKTTTYYRQYRASRERELATARPAGAAAATNTPRASILLGIAEQVNIAPCLLARQILRMHFLDAHGDWSEATVKAEVNNAMKSPQDIADPILRDEVLQCIEGDDNYSPDVTLAKQLMGHEYELRLRLNLTNAGIPFISEADMRKLGYPKTPDFRLQVPCVVYGRVVQWIESKASFGDPISYESHANEQYWKYYNRFGPGLVIYWFGFVDELAKPDEPFLLLDHFPAGIQPLRPIEPVDLLPTTTSQ